MKATDVAALKANCRRRPSWDRDKWQRVPWNVNGCAVATDAHALLAIRGRWTEKTCHERPVAQLKVAAEWIAATRPSTFKTTVDLLRVWCSVEIPAFNEEGEPLSDNDKRDVACGRLRKTLFDRRLIDRVLLGRDGWEFVSVYVDDDVNKWATLRGEGWTALVMPMWCVNDGREPEQVPQFTDEMRT